MPINIPCKMFHAGKCGHPVASGLFSQGPCLLTMGDPRIKECACQAQYERPAPSMPPVKPPRQP